MPNLTPVKYRKLYEIYPAKACIEETGSACNGCLRSRINAIWAAYCPRAGRKEAARAASGGVVLNAAVSKQVRTYGT
jgi:hypothetical protein